MTAVSGNGCWHLHFQGRPGGLADQRRRRVSTPAMRRPKTSLSRRPIGSRMAEPDLGGEHPRSSAETAGQSIGQGHEEVAPAAAWCCSGCIAARPLSSCGCPGVICRIVSLSIGSVGSETSVAAADSISRGSGALASTRTK